MKNFLIVKTSALGDIIQAYPVVEFLKSKFPQAKITWVVEQAASELVQAHPLVDECLIIDTKQWRKGWWSYRKSISRAITTLRSKRYDAVFDLQGNLKSGIVTALAKANDKVGFNSKCVAEKVNILFTTHRFDVPEGFNVREDYLKLVQQYFHDDTHYQGDKENILLKITPAQQQRLASMLAHHLLQKKPLIIIAPGAKWPNKMVTIEFLQLFLKPLTEKAVLGFVWGTPKEREVAEILNSSLQHSIVFDKMPLPLLQNLMDHAQQVISMDSLALHLAGTTSASTFSFFGPSHGDKYAPEGESHRHYQGACPYGEHFVKRCSKLRSCISGSCLKNLDPTEVLKTYEEE
ncbi:MAG: glycosyltransferase family 9 protein [Chlamydiota bacterium]